MRTLDAMLFAGNWVSLSRTSPRPSPTRTASSYSTFPSFPWFGWVPPRHVRPKRGSVVSPEFLSEPLPVDFNVTREASSSFLFTPVPLYRSRIFGCPFPLFSKPFGPFLPRPVCRAFVRIPTFPLLEVIRLEAGPLGAEYPVLPP